MEQVKAYFNHGKWIVDCPNCPAATKVKIGDELVFCGHCFPDKRVKKFQLVAGQEVMPVSDKEKQDQAKTEAFAMGEVYEIVFPDDAKSAETVLRKRKTEHQNYVPWKETLENLEKENLSHPKLKYLWDKKEHKKYLEVIKPKKKIKAKKLSEKELRRIK